MLSTARHTAKEYIERGVQTDVLRNTPSPQPATSCGNMDSPPAQTQSDVVNTTTVATSPLSSHSNSSTHIDSAYIQDQPDLSFESTCSSADHSMTTTSRAYRLDQISVNRPASLLNRQPSSRVLSLPEATPRFYMKKVLEKKTARVVSTPLPVNRDASFEGLYASSNVEDSFVAEDSQGSVRVRVRTSTSDAPYTLSTPSSPDSVVIIANNSNQLSTDFLRQRADDESPPDSDDDGWIAWAPSPPRPIPALHGPLSLPYARCPSGAEGTVIEEPGSLTRIIWGLESEATTSRFPKLTKPQSAPSNKSAEQFTGNITGLTLNATRPSGLSSAPVIQATSSTTVAQSLPTRHDATSTGSSLPHQPSQPPEFILKHSEPIDLGRLVNNSPDPNHDAPIPDYYGWQTSQHEFPTPDLVPDLSPELHAILFAQEQLRNQWLSPSSSASPANMAGLLKPPTPASAASTSLLDSLKSTRSPIILEELASQYSPYSLSRTPVLDLAQKYQQQQLQRSFLPTPPNSTSPMWSSTFSPYQSDLLSPNMLVAAGLSQLHPSYVPSQTVPPGLDSSHHAMKSNARSTSSVGGHRAKSSVLAPATPISIAAMQKLPPRLAAEYTRRRTLQETPADDLQLQNRLVSQVLPSVHNMSLSPAMPKAPPNTPLDTPSQYGQRRRDEAAHSSALAIPSSPTSPRNPQSLSLTQHVRSVPLSRLIQRRLSTVLEEDYASAAESGPTLPATARASSSGLHLFLSPSGRHNVLPTSTPGYLRDTLGTRYGMDDIEGKARDITPGVKLPSVPGKASSSGPIAHNGQFVKEATRRQGSSNANSDGGQRGDSGRGRGQKRGGRGRKARGAVSNGPHGAERVDGGLVVKS